MTTGHFDQLRSVLADRYRVERELGQGGMATVYLAHDLRHERKVAIKVLRPELAAVIGADRFVREIRTVAALQHPHILGLIDSGEVGGTAYYVMPFVEGESLRDRLNHEKQLPIADAVRIATEVASALDYAHRHGVIHRDIKPENILLHDGQALVADFGIALAVTQAGGARMTETGMSLGTPHYMSPEQAMGEREITARSDVYALGCVTYEMLTGDPPFTGPTAQAIVAKVLTEKPAAIRRVRERVPESVEEAVLTALEKLPADRFASAAEFAQALGGRGTVARPRGASRSRPWLSDRRSRLAVGVAVAAVATSLLLLAWGRRPSAPSVSFAQKTFAHQAIFNARFAPDGQTILFSAAPKGSTPRLFIIRPDYPEPQSIGPDSTHLLSISRRGEIAVLIGARYVGHHRLFTGTLARMPLGGGAPREILADVREADWAHDGSSLAVIRAVGGSDRLEYPIGRVLYRTGGYLSDPRVSPDGKRVAFFQHPSFWDDRGSVVIVDREGHHTELSSGYWGLEGLAWTADGRRVLFSGTVENGYSSYEVREVDLRGRARVLLRSAGGLTLQDVTGRHRLLVTQDAQQYRLFGRPPGADRERELGWLDASDIPRLSRDGRLLAFVDGGATGGSTYAVMLRKTDGSPAVRLGDGLPYDISSDGRAVLAVVPAAESKVMLYPTGPGEPRRVDGGAFESLFAARFLSGETRVLICGSQQGQGPRCYARAPPDGPLQPLTPEGTRFVAVSPDGGALLAQVGDSFGVYPVDGGVPHGVPGMSPGDRVVRWSPKGDAIWVARLSEYPLRVDRVDPRSGRRTPLLVIAPADRTGLLSTPDLSLADDPRVYAYVEFRYNSTLFVAEGVR